MKPHWQRAEEFSRNLFVNAKGRRQPGSGNVAGKPGDVRYVDRVRFSFDNDVLLESKARKEDKDSLCIKKEWLDKITSEALHMGGRVPLFMLTFSEHEVGGHWLMVPTWSIEQESHAD